MIVEAGTGVGKSFGYLVPAILAVTSDEGRPASKGDDEKPKRKPIIISTHTISLQEQLLSKDLPFLRAVTPQEFTSVLVKGRSNYISLRRLDIAHLQGKRIVSRNERIRGAAAVSVIGPKIREMVRAAIWR